MSSPRNTNNSPNNSEYRKGGNPLGFILGLLIFGGVIFGLYYLWKSKQAGNTSLNFNPNNPQQVQTDNTGTIPAQDNTNQASQTQSYSEFNQNSNQSQNQTPRQKARKQKHNQQYNSPNNSGSLEQKNQLTYKSQDGKNRVLSGYGGNSNSVEQNSNQANKNLIYILPQKFFPSNGIVAGSLQSLVTDHQNITNGLPRPDQLIYFATGFYEREEALKFATNKLKSLGFQRIRLASDQYRKGGQTVMEALDSKNNQIFFFFKPNNQNNQMTLWKAEIYSAHKLSKKP